MIDVIMMIVIDMSIPHLKKALDDDHRGRYTPLGRYTSAQLLEAVHMKIWLIDMPTYSMNALGMVRGSNAAQQNHPQVRHAPERLWCDVDGCHSCCINRGLGSLVALHHRH